MRCWRIGVVAALAVVVAVGAFASASQEKSAPAQGAKIGMSVWGMPWENKLYTDFLIPRFEKQNPGIKVEFFHFDNYNDKLPVLYAGGELPDVTRVNANRLRDWVSKGMYMPLDKYMDLPVEKGGIDRKDFVPAAFEVAHLDGKTYAIPQDINFKGLMYNKALFKKGGAALPNANWTWNDVITISQKLDHLEGPDQYGFGNWWDSGSWRLMFGLAGGTVWADDLKDPLIATEAGVKTMELWKTLIGKNDPLYVGPQTTSSGAVGGLGADKYFEMGKRAMHVDGMWRPPSVTKNAPDLDFGMVPFPPLVKGKGTYIENHGCLFAVSSRTKNPDRAWQLARALVSDGAGVEYWRMTWVGPPARFSDYKDPEFRKIKGIPGVVPSINEQQYAERCQWVIDVLEGRAAPPSSHWIKSLHNAVLDDSLKVAIEKVIISKVDPMVALKEAVAEMKRTIK